MKAYFHDIGAQMRFMLPYCLRLYFAPATGALIGLRTAWRALAVQGVSMKRISLLLVSPVSGAFRYIRDESARYEHDLKQFYVSRDRQAQEHAHSNH